MFLTSRGAPRERGDDVSDTLYVHVMKGRAKISVIAELDPKIPLSILNKRLIAGINRNILSHTFISISKV